MADRIRRWSWIAAGWVLVTLGVIGVFVPVWPTTIFVVLASGCFMRGEPRLAAWLERTRLLGPFVRAARTGVMPRRAKYISLGLMWAFVSLALWRLLFREEGPLWIPTGFTIALAGVGTYYIARLKTAGRPKAAAEIEPLTDAVVQQAQARLVRHEAHGGTPIFEVKPRSSRPVPAGS